MWRISFYERHRTNFICLLFLKPKVCFWGSNAGLNCLTNKPKSEKILQFLNWILLLDSGSLMLFPFNLTILSRLFRHQYVNCYVDYSLSHCTHAHFDIKERTQDKLTIAWRWITCYFRIPSKMKTLLFVVRRKNITPLLLFQLKSIILICYFSLAVFTLETEYPSETG